MRHQRCSHTSLHRSLQSDVDTRSGSSLLWRAACSPTHLSLFWMRFPPMLPSCFGSGMQGSRGKLRFLPSDARKLRCCHSGRPWRSAALRLPRWEVCAVTVRTQALRGSAEIRVQWRLSSWSMQRMDSSAPELHWNIGAGSGWSLAVRLTSEAHGSRCGARGRPGDQLFGT